MRAFLSHSSSDKGFIEAVAENLRPGTYELDSETFDGGLINTQAIIKAIQRCDLFCLFLSRNSVTSSYVEFETLLGIEFLAKAQLSQFLVVCLDDDAFGQATANVKFFNIVRKIITPEAAARLIEGQLISTIGRKIELNHPFVGREAEIAELEMQISDHARPLIRGLFISGNSGAGRRTLARKFYEAQFPGVGKIFPQIEIDAFDGLEELHRSVLMTLRPTISTHELKSRTVAFEVAKNEEQQRQIAQLLNALLIANEAAILVDKGGILADAGGFAPEMSKIISHLDARPHPPAIFISSRVMPRRLRRPENDVAYAEVRVLKWEAANRLIARLLKEQSISITLEQNSQLTTLSECHPYNIYRLIEDISDRGIGAFLASPREFIDWKHRQSSEYLNKILFSDNEKLILDILRIIPQLDFEAIVLAASLPAPIVSDALQRLSHLHIVDTDNNSFQIAPPLRIAVERDTRIRFPNETRQAVIKSLAASLTMRIEAGIAPINLINSAVLSEIESGNTPSEFAAAFMLPSHHVWLCKHHYDQRHWADCIRYGREALRSTKRLSMNGLVGACRFICLASARLGQAHIFKEAIEKLESAAVDNWAKSNVAYLKGFELRNKGSLPAAEEFFEDANTLSPGNLSAIRELAAIALLRGKFGEAETLAREALHHAPSNAFLLDILIAVLIRKYGRAATKMSELNSLFQSLETVGEESGRSFYTTRKAEFEHLWGDNGKALDLINLAIKKTPHLFEPRRLQAEIFLKSGNKTKASEALKTMRQMVEARDDHQGRYHYRTYLETYSHYLVEIGNFDEAKELFNDLNMFTQLEQVAAIKDIEMTEGYKRVRDRR